jgi:hypothetical protein
MRAALASCVATGIAAEAAAQGIELTRLEVIARSTSDMRGLLGMADALGERVSAGPRELRLEVRVGASGAAQVQLQAIIGHSCRCSPVTAALESAVPVAVHIEIDPG